MNNMCRKIFLLLLVLAGGSVLANAAFDPMEFVREEVAKGNKNIVVPPGTYKISPKGKIYLELKDLVDTTILFDNVKVIGTVNVQMLDIENCRNLTLRGLTVDYDPLPFTQGRITSVDKDRSWVVKIMSGYPKKDILLEGDTRVQVFSSETGELINPLRYANQLKVVRLDADSFKITGGGNRIGEVGDIVVFNASNGTANCTVVRSRRSDNLTFEKFTVYSGTMAFVETNNSKTVYKNCVIDRCPPENDYTEREYPRLRSLNADAFHCKDGRIGPRILNCIAKYMGDDGVNVSGMYSLVTASKGDELRILVPFDLIMTPGDMLEIMTIDGKKVPEVKVLSIVPDGTITSEEAEFVSKADFVEFYRNPQSPCLKKAYRLKLDRSISLPMGSVVISTAHMGNGFVIKECEIGFIRSRGILIKASNGTIADNTLKECWGPGIKVSPEYYWLEGGCSGALKITNNRIENNRDWPILIAGEAGIKSDLPANSHYNIQISNNDIANSSQGIKVAGCTGLIIENNKLSLKDGPQDDILNLANVEQVKMDGNLITRQEGLSDREFIPMLDSVIVNGQPLYLSKNMTRAK